MSDYYACHVHLNTQFNNEAIFQMYFFVVRHPWEKTINNKSSIDFGRYVRLLLDLFQEFPVTEIKTEID